MDEMDGHKKKMAGKKHGMIELARIAPAVGGKPPVHEMISKRLRGYFDELAKQPMPDRFLELLDRLEAKTLPEKED